MKILKFNLMFVLVLLVGVLNAQVIGGRQTKLEKFYAEERWEDCAFRAERMVLQEKYKNDPEINLYLAASYAKVFLMCLEDSTLLNKVPEYLNAYNYALKYSTVAKRKDKKTQIIFPKNNFMLEEIAITGIHYIDHYMSIKRVPKANSYLRKIMKVYSDENFKFLNGVLSVMTGDTATGNPLIRETFANIDSRKAREELNTDFIMIDAFDYYVNFLMNQETPLVDSAKNVANRGVKCFPDCELLKYNLKLIDDPELKAEKPKNEKKKLILKSIVLNSLNENDEDDDVDDEDDD